MLDMLGVIFYEQRSMATKWGKQASRVADARKIGFLEAPDNDLFTSARQICSARLSTASAASCIASDNEG